METLAGLVGPAELSDQLCRLIDAMGAGTIEVESPGPKLKDVLKKAGSLLNPQKTVSEARKLIVEAEQARSALSSALGSASKADPAVADTIVAFLQAFEQSFNKLDEKGAFTLSGKGDATARGVWDDVQKRSEGTSVLFAQAAFVDNLRMGLSTLEGGAPPTEDDSCVRKLQDEVGKDAMAPLTAEQADTWQKKARSVRTFIRELAESAKEGQSDGRHEVLWRLQAGADALVRVNKVIAAGVDPRVESTLRDDACRRVLAWALPGSVGAALPESPISWEELHKADGWLARLKGESERVSVSGGSGAAASPMAEKLKALAIQAAEDVRKGRRQMIADVEPASGAEEVINQAKKLAARAGTFTKLEACGWDGWSPEEARSLKSGSTDDEGFLRNVISAQHDSERRPLTLIVRIAEVLRQYGAGPNGDSTSILADAARTAACRRLRPLLESASERMSNAAQWIRDDVSGKYPFDRESTQSADPKVLTRWDDDTIEEIDALAELTSAAWPEGVEAEAKAFEENVAAFKNSLGDVPTSAFFKFVRLIRDSKYDVSAALLRPPKGLLRQAVGESPNSRGCIGLTDLKANTKSFDRKWLDDKDKTAIVSICCRPSRPAAADNAACSVLKSDPDNQIGVMLGAFKGQDSPELRFEVTVQEMKRGKPAGKSQQFPLPSGAETPANDWGMLRWLMRADRSADGGTASMKLPLVPGCDDAVEVMIVAKDGPLPPSLGQWPIVRNRTLMGGGR